MMHGSHLMFGGFLAWKEGQLHFSFPFSEKLVPPLFADLQTSSIYSLDLTIWTV